MAQPSNQTCTFLDVVFATYIVTVGLTNDCFFLIFGDGTGVLIKAFAVLIPAGASVTWRMSSHLPTILV